MGRRATGAGLPAVLAAPLSADRLAVELEVAAGMVGGEDPLSRDRRAFLLSAAAQVANYGVAGSAHTETEPAQPLQLRPRGNTPDEDLETRTG